MGSLHYPEWRLPASNTVNALQTPQKTKLQAWNLFAEASVVLRAVNVVAKVLFLQTWIVQEKDWKFTVFNNVFEHLNH